MSANVLKKAGFFSNFKDPELRRVMAISKEAKYAKDELIFDRETVGNAFFVVLKGRVKIFTGEGRRMKTLAYLGEGDFLGEMALLGGKVRSASAMAAEDSRLLVITKNNFLKLLGTDRQFSLSLLRTLSDRLRQANHEIESLLFHNMIGRLACAILQLCRECGAISEPAEIKMTLRELADYVGTTREPLSRALAMLKRSGAITYEDKTLTVRDFSKLKSISPRCVL